MKSPEARYVAWASREPGTARIVGTLIFGACLFLGGFPLLLALRGPWLDRRLGLPMFAGHPGTTVLGVALAVVGGALAFWSVVGEVRVGRGTPVPMIPTRRLVVVPPFTYCRNPMVLGTATAYLGLGLWVGSVSAVVFVLVFAGLLLLYVKVLEERELEARFGDEYRLYKESTPFLIPRWRGRGAG